MTVPSTDGRRLRAGRAALVALTVSGLGGVWCTVGYWAGWSDGSLGAGLAAALGGMGVGLVAWAKSLDVDHVAVEEREPLAGGAQAAVDDIATTTDETVGRRRLLGVALVGSLGAMVASAVGPLWSLGPRPRGERSRTAWAPGTRVVTTDGTPIRAWEGRLDQLVTAFPEGHVGRDDSQIVLLRVRPELVSEATRRGGAVDGWIAYSKICTHAGCSVGLFGIDDREPDTLRQLVCPCHQSVFDPLDAARPIGGPAPRPLPQLPLAVDSSGLLVATSDFDRPVGPIAWDEG